MHQLLYTTGFQCQQGPNPLLDSIDHGFETMTTRLQRLQARTENKKVEHRERSLRHPGANHPYLQKTASLAESANYSGIVRSRIPYLPKKVDL
ncbi:hypothetical protein TNCV_57721 [Trichonephila clavipes]|nr:hypothetical protein TNCV_57721 [Trichonephila clavipes]